jgi:hypothetical protein
MTTQQTASRALVLLSAALFVIQLIIPAAAFGARINSAGDPALAGALFQDFDGEVGDSYFTSQYFTVRSAANDRALIDDLSYRVVPEPNLAMLIALGLLTLAGTRLRDLQPDADKSDSDDA